MDSKLDHQDAINLEYIVRSVFDCGRGGVMNIANADQLERKPMNAAIAIFAPLYFENRVLEDLSDFMDRYNCIFDYDDYEFNQETIDKYIYELKALVKKYYDK